VAKATKAQPNQPELTDEQRERASIKASLLATNGAGFKPRVAIDRRTGIKLNGEFVEAIAAELGIEVETIYVDVDDPVETRLRLKYARRHPDELARAIEVVRELGEPVAAAARKRHGKRRRPRGKKNVAPVQQFGRTCEILAEIACCSPSTINNAVALLKPKSEDLIAGVLGGDLPVKKAIKAARKHRDNPQALAAVVAAMRSERAVGRARTKHAKPTRPVGTAELAPRSHVATALSVRIAEEVREVLDDWSACRRNRRRENPNKIPFGVAIVHGDDGTVHLRGATNDPHQRASIGVTGAEIEDFRRRLRESGIIVDSTSAENFLSEFVCTGGASLSLTTATLEVRVGAPAEESVA
jgi:lambda repressor-like predicted transcriptional regulator